ncbi:MAG: hypothetical protein CL814_02725 [Confluentimicrobium sp.]|uniref:anti-sigma factor n=1 Tax=Actibacterium sp. TaxID=1872125 RepID=UPI000C4AFEAB|nr:anti-sigma factor [Actibacterium sp.]MBC55827.1 hypothetical protein [Actibacterium sp.]
MTDGRQITGDDASRAAEYVLGLMGAFERRAFEAEMAESAVLRDEVRAWDEDLISLAQGFDEVAPGPHVRGALEDRLFGREARRGIWSSLSFWRGLAGAALVGAAALAFLLMRPVVLPPAADAPVFVSQIATEDNALQMAAVFDAGAGVLQINRVAGAPAEGRVLELWLIAGEGAPVSLGVLPPERRGRIAVPEALADQFRNAVMAISDEPPGGSPTGAPTGRVLAVGVVTAL